MDAALAHARVHLANGRLQDAAQILEQSVAGEWLPLPFSKPVGSMNEVRTL